jgi:hypothetical protein
MKEIRISLEQFDLASLLEKTINFLKERVFRGVDPTYGIVWVQSVGDVPVSGPESGWDVLSAVTKEGKIVFFPFAYADADGTFACVDDNTCGQEPEDEDTENNICIGMEDRIGFLVQIKDNTVSINSAIHAGGACPGPGPAVDLHPDCGVLEEPMENFIRSFIRD